MTDADLEHLARNRGYIPGGAGIFNRQYAIPWLRERNAAMPPVAAASSSSSSSSAVAVRSHPENRLVWFRDLIEELEPLHDCTEARLAHYVCVMDNILSVINWDILKDIEPVGISARSTMNDAIIPDNEHKVKNLDERVCARAIALDRANADETVGTEVAIQILVGEYISRHLPREFPNNIHTISNPIAGTKRSRKFSLGGRTTAFKNDNLNTLFTDWRRSDFFYSEAAGISSVSKYIRNKNISPIDITTRYVDPGSSKKTKKSLSFTSYSNDILGNITCVVNPDDENSSHNSSRSNNNTEEEADVNITRVSAENYEEYPLLAFPTAAAAGLVANILRLYVEKRQIESTKSKSSSSSKPVIEAIQYLIESQDDLVGEIKSSKSGDSSFATNLPEDILNQLLHDLVIDGGNKLIQIADESVRGEYKPKEESSSTSNTGSNSINTRTKKIKKEAEALSRPVSPSEVGNNEAAYRLLALSELAPQPTTRLRPGSRASGYASDVSSLFEVRDGEFGLSKNLIGYVAEEYEKSLKNIQNFVKLVILGVNIYEKLYKIKPETALQTAMRTILHLKSYGDSFQLKELDSIMRKPENTGKVLWLTSNDRIFLALAGLYAIDGGWNLMTIQQSVKNNSLILRDYRKNRSPRNPNIILTKSEKRTRRKIMKRQNNENKTKNNNERSKRAVRRLARFVPIPAPAPAPAPVPVPVPAPANNLRLGINIPNRSPQQPSAPRYFPALSLDNPPLMKSYGQKSPASQIGYIPEANNNNNNNNNNNRSHIGGFYRHRQRKTLKKRKGRRHTRRRT